MKKITIIILCLLVILVHNMSGFASELNNSIQVKTVGNDYAEDGFAEDLEDDLEEDEDESTTIWDPLEKINRGSFYFNDKMYFWLLNPSAKVYKKYTPNFIRKSLLNFFNNLEMPQRAINCLLQTRLKESGTEVLAFGINSTIGILGFTKPSEKYFNFKCYSEDMGQTFGSYGIGNGLYIVLPFLGSSSMRDLIGYIGDAFLDPLDYIRNKYIYAGATAVKTVNNISFRIGEYEAMKEAAFEPYSAMKDAYIQYRNKQIGQ